MEKGDRTRMLRLSFSNLPRAPAWAFFPTAFPPPYPPCHTSRGLVCSSAPAPNLVYPSSSKEYFFLMRPRNQLKSELITLIIFNTLKLISSVGQNFSGHFCTDIWENSFIKRTFFRTPYLTTNGLINLSTIERVMKERVDRVASEWLHHDQSEEYIHNQNGHLPSAQNLSECTTFGASHCFKITA